MTENKEVFDIQGFFDAVEAKARQGGLTWKQVSEQTKVSQSTLTRLAQGRGCDSQALVALSHWAGLDVRKFYGSGLKRNREETLSLLSRALRKDPNVSTESRAALESVFRTAYQSLAKKK